MTTLELLIKAKRLISKPERWCRGPLAFNAERVPVMPKAGSAVCWCALGALMHVEVRYSVAARNYLNMAANENGYIGADVASDEGGHGMAIKVYKRAIKLARARLRKAKAK